MDPWDFTSESHTRHRTNHSLCNRVHRILGPGLLESIYEECLASELTAGGLRVERQKELPVIYKGSLLAAVYRADMIVNEAVRVEVKSVEKLLGVHRAQLLPYMKLTDIGVGLLLNFNTAYLTDGIKRVSI